MNLALFDLDNTLLTSDSDFEWSQFLIEKQVLDRKAYESRNLEFYEQYKAGTLDIHQFLDFQLQPLSRYSRIQLDDWHNEFMAKKIMPHIAPTALPKTWRESRFRPATSTTEYIIVMSLTPTYGATSPEAMVETITLGNPTGNSRMAVVATEVPPEPPNASTPST